MIQHAITFTTKAARTTLAFAFQTCCNVGLDNVAVHALATSGAPSPAGPTITLRIATPTVAAGSRQIIQGTAGTKAAVALVVDYPDGTPLLAPLKADSDGHFTGKWTVPASVHGTVDGLVDSAGATAHSSFTVS